MAPGRTSGPWGQGRGGRPPGETRDSGVRSPWANRPPARPRSGPRLHALGPAAAVIMGDVSRPSERCRFSGCGRTAVQAHVTDRETEGGGRCRPGEPTTKCRAAAPRGLRAAPPWGAVPGRLQAGPAAMWRHPRAVPAACRPPGPLLEPRRDPGRGAESRVSAAGGRQGCC